jgi:hypothetical protein
VEAAHKVCCLFAAACFLGGLHVAKLHWSTGWHFEVQLYSKGLPIEETLSLFVAVQIVSPLQNTTSALTS